MHVTGVGVLLLAAAILSSAREVVIGGVPRTLPDVVPRPGPDWRGWQMVNREDRFNWFLSHIQFHMVPVRSSPSFLFIYFLLFIYFTILFIILFSEFYCRRL
jgi:hypothetical protein